MIWLNRFLLLTIASCFIALVASAWVAHGASLGYEQETLKLIEKLKAEEKANSLGKQALEVLSFGYYDGYSKDLEAIKQLRESGATLKEKAQYASYAFAALSLLLPLLVIARSRDIYSAGYALIPVSFIALVVGLTTPLLTIEASRELPVLGNTIFQYESKGIIGTVETLFAIGQAPLATLIFLFSILLPLCKTALLALAACRFLPNWARGGIHWMKHIGKWSMVDVFVVAVLVAMFAADANKLTRAEAHIDRKSVV